jgi:hypothetical protein
MKIVKPEVAPASNPYSERVPMIQKRRKLQQKSNA